jgi:hypothetical protein
VPYGLLRRGRFEEVLEHASVDVAVLRLRRTTGPRGEEDVCRAHPPHDRGNRVGVLEICNQRADPLVDAFRVTTESRDLPTVGEETPGEVPSADARHSDDECTSAHIAPRSEAS